jgi:putative ATP-dependent endonuclease of OLD family
MFIQYVRVKNYRSFADVSMYFNEQANYLVGENSIGKSSVLKLLSMLASGTGLDESDYADPSRPVVVIADIVLHGEQEKFVNEQERQETRVRLRFEKRIEEISPRLYNDENGQMLPLNLIRRFRYIFHSSVMPEQHILTAHVHKMLEHQLKDLCGTELDIVLPKEVWAFAQQQELHGNYDASYYVNIMYLSRLLSREDRPLADNMKFISIVALKIIAQVELMYHSHAVPFSHGLVRGVDGKIYLPLVIAIDEPEVHLQPYLQRSILTYYKQLLHNQDPAFCQLLKKLFNVDGLQGQLFIVTHSTDCSGG